MEEILCNLDIYLDEFLWGDMKKLVEQAVKVELSMARDKTGRVGNTSPSPRLFH